MPVSGSPAFDTSFLTLLRQTGEGPDQQAVDAPPSKTGVAQKGAGAGAAAPVGSGATAQVGDAPDIAANTAATSPGHTGLAVAVASLLSMMPRSKSDDDTEVELASVEAKMKQTTDKVGANEITSGQQRQRNALAAKREQLEKAKTDMEDAAKAQKHASTWDKVKLAFSYVGAILTIAAGVLVALTAPLTGGLSLVAGGLLIAGGVMMLMMAVDQTMSMVPGKDGQPGKGFIAMTAEAITKRLYPNDTDKQQSEAQKWTMGLTITLMVASAICGIAGAVVNPAGVATEMTELPTMVSDVADVGTEAGDAAEAGSAVETATTSATDVETATSDATEVGSDATTAGTDSSGAASEGTNASGAAEETEEVEEVTEVADDTETSAKQVENGEKDATGKSDSEASTGTKPLKIRVAEKASEGSAYKHTITASEGVNDAANAGTDGASLYYHYEASTSTASGLNASAQGKQFEALDKSLDDAMDAIMLRLKNDGDRFSNVLGTLMSATKDHGDTMSHLRFRA